MGGHFRCDIKRNIKIQKSIFNAGAMKSSTNTKDHQGLLSTKVTSSTSFKASSTEKKAMPTRTTYDLHERKRKSQVKTKGFQVWRQNWAENNDTSNEHKKSNHSEANILQVVHPESEMEGRCVPSESVCTSASQQTISPDMFDSLADQIVNRVKKELNLNTAPRRPTESSSDRNVYSPDSYQTKKELKVLVQKMDSHHCQNCWNLMVRSFRN